MFSFELQFLKYLESIRNDFLNIFFEVITFLGEETLMILFVVTLWFAVNKRLAQKVLFITAGSLCVNGIIKNLVKAPRPFTKGISCLREGTASGYSFPSGHTQGFATWSAIIAIIYKIFWLRILLGVLVILVGFSRLYLGAHYPSDVITGILLGVGVAFLGNMLFDRVRDTKKLYIASLIVFAPFFVYFLFEPEPLYANFYKTFGMIGGLCCTAFLDEKVETLSFDVALWKKVLRVVIGIVVAFIFKEGIKALNVFDTIQISLVFDAVRYFVVVFALGFLCPLLFKKIRL